MKQERENTGASLKGIGFAGLGLLGRALAERVAEQGYVVTTWNRTPGGYDGLAEKEIGIAGSFDGLCTACNWIFSCVSDDAAFAAINEHIMNASAKPDIHVSFSTCSPGAVRRTAERLGREGVPLLNCPVMGRPDIVRAGKAGFLLAGPEKAASMVMPVIDRLGANVHYLGSEQAHSSAMKLAINFLIACTIGGLTESVAALSRAGVSSDRLLEVIAGSALNSPVMQLFGEQLVDRTYDSVLFQLGLARKDIGYFKQLFENGNDPLMANALLQHMDRSEKATDKPLDWAGLASHLLAGD